MFIIGTLIFFKPVLKSSLREEGSKRVEKNYDYSTGIKEKAYISVSSDENYSSHLALKYNALTSTATVSTESGVS